MSATVNGTRKMGSSVEIGNKAASSTAAANRDGTGTSVGSVNGFSFNKSNAAGDKLKKCTSIIHILPKYIEQERLRGH